MSAKIMFFYYKTLCFP